MQTQPQSTMTAASTRAARLKARNAKMVAAARAQNTPTVKRAPAAKKPRKTAVKKQRKHVIPTADEGEPPVVAAEADQPPPPIAADNPAEEVRQTTPRAVDAGQMQTTPRAISTPKSDPLPTAAVAAQSTETAPPAAQPALAPARVRPSTISNRVPAARGHAATALKLVNEAASAENSTLHRPSALACAQHGLACAILNTTTKMLLSIGTSDETQFFEQFAVQFKLHSNASADVDAGMAFLWNLHREDSVSGRILFVEYAKRIRYGADRIRGLIAEPASEVTAVDGFVTYLHVCRLLSYGMCETHYGNELAALDPYLRGLADACGRLGADAAALPAEEVRRCLILVTLERLFFISLSVAVGVAPPRVLASWLDERCVGVTFRLAAMGLPSAVDGSAHGQLLGTLTNILSTQNLLGILEEARNQPRVAFTGCERAFDV
jgi:hypothetical protein